MNILFVIPARGGSKGLPGKNIKPLDGKPLIHYSLQYARLFTNDNNIYVSTDDTNIAASVEAAGYRVPFMRPDALASDTAGMREVLIHALDEFEKKGNRYEALVLLQPTSPFRKKIFLEEALAKFSSDTDMVVSVNQSKANPYFNLFEEDENGFLKISKNAGIVSRQQAPPVYQYNGNLYIINTSSLRLYDSLAAFPRIIKYEIPAEYAIDIDNAADWNQAEYIITNHLVQIDGKL